MHEPDPRCDLFEALRKRFEQENPGYTLRGFLCGGIPDGEIVLTPNGHYHEDQPFELKACASDSVIRSLLMREIEPENLVDYAKSFQFLVHKPFEVQAYEVNPEMLETVFEGLDYTKNANPQPKADITKEKVSLAAHVWALIKNLF